MFKPEQGGLREASRDESIEEAPGHKGEKIVIEFLREAFPSLIVDIERTSPRDSNDRNGVDFFCTIRGEDGQCHKLAFDVTFANDERKNFKMERMVKSPLAVLRDENGKPIGQPMPRALLYERSMGLWFDYKTKAEAKGMELITIMDDKNKNEQRNRFLETVLEQARGISSLPPDASRRIYKEKMGPIRESFEREMKESKNAA